MLALAIIVTEEIIIKDCQVHFHYKYHHQMQYKMHILLVVMRIHHLINCQQKIVIPPTNAYCFAKGHLFLYNGLVSNTSQQLMEQIMVMALVTELVKYLYK